jgi:predicted alpha-1,2-mannosidase
MAQPGPDTRLTGWDGCSGYHAADTVLYGFSQTHLSGTGISDYGDVLLLPATGEVKLRSGYRAVGEEAPTFDPAGYGSRFRKARETASPGYYSVDLDDYGVRAELTATLRTALHRYTFSRAANPHVLLDLEHRGKVLESSLRIVDDRTVEGMRRTSAWAKDRPVFFIARFSRPFKATLVSEGKEQPGAATLAGTALKALLRFDLKPGAQVLAKVGLSAVDAAGARTNLDKEQPRWEFEKVRARARAAWAKELGRATVTDGTDAQRTIFYTALYHAFLQPCTFMDADGRHLGRDKAPHQAQGHVQHTVFSLWDTFRAAHPLYTLLQPGRTRDFIRTFLTQWEEGGRLPVWELWGNETDCMVGNHAIPVIVDAWLKGIRGFDGEEAFRAMKAAASDGSRGLRAFRRFGFIPSDQEPESVSKTLEYAYDDWCIARMAQSLGHEKEAETWLGSSLAYRHLLDPATHLMRPRTEARWKAPFDPAEVDFNFTEANAWQYSFFVPHDVEGHMALLGGPEAYAAKLDDLFAAPAATTGRDQSDITGLVGQYAHGNEPSHHMAYLYSYAGQPWKTQALARRLLDEMYHDAPDGLIGNEDCGQMSAWFVLSAFGFYPVNPCGGDYVLGSPLFGSATLRLGNGAAFTVRRVGPPSAPYIQSATLDGLPWTRSWIRHEDLLKGGELVLTMGGKPNRDWGSAPADRPSSAVDWPRVQPAPFVASGEARFADGTTVTLASPLKTGILHYTLDGTPPTEISPLYPGPLDLKETTTVKFLSLAQGFAPSPVVEARFTQWRPLFTVKLASPWHRQYPGAGEQTLGDGVRGGLDFRLGPWQGFYNVDLDATLDFGAVRPLRRLALGCLQDQDSWLFMPSEVSFELSTDGLVWTPLGVAANTVPQDTPTPVIRDFVVEFPPAEGRYVRVRARNPGPCPAWHKGAGLPTFIFVDEVLVD